MQATAHSLEHHGILPDTRPEAEHLVSRRAPPGCHEVRVLHRLKQRAWTRVAPIPPCKMRNLFVQHASVVLRKRGAPSVQHWDVMHSCHKVLRRPCSEICQRCSHATSHLAPGPRTRPSCPSRFTRMACSIRYVVRRHFLDALAHGLVCRRLALRLHGLRVHLCHAHPH